jgi:hypothetical protein
MREIRNCAGARAIYKQDASSLAARNVGFVSPNCCFSISARSQRALFSAAGSRPLSPTSDLRENYDYDIMTMDTFRSRH